MHNTISYAGSSMASQMTANVMTGQDPFNNLGKAVLNPGIIVPTTVDFLSVTVPLALNTKLGTKFVTNRVRKILDKHAGEYIGTESIVIEKLKMFQVEVGMLDNENFGIRTEFSLKFPETSWAQSTRFASIFGVNGKPINPYTINLLTRSQYNTYLGLYLNSFRPTYIP